MTSNQLISLLILLVTSIIISMLTDIHGDVYVERHKLSSPDVRQGDI